jgi:hypothetical protein
MAVFLNELSIKTQKHFHLDIEPEPDCILEDSFEVMGFFGRLNSLDLRNEAVVRNHITLCFDICHFSVEYEDPVAALRRIAERGIKIGKIQISSALKAVPGKPDDFLNFKEPRYLHQTVKRTAKGGLKRFRDLSDAIKDRTDADEWRTHFHVPLFVNRYGALQSTQDDVLKVIGFLKKEHITEHLEVETYTWDVLPSGLKEELAASVSRELEWVKNNFNT